MSTSLDSKIQLLRDRAHMLGAVRAFFLERDVLEVDCPILSPSSSIDLHIEVMEVVLKDNSRRYLHTSPEYRMKRLLSEGMGDLYQLGHVFREGEIGKLHNPEFTMIEWYRKEISFEAFVNETIALLHLFLGNLPHSQITYREAIYAATGIDYHTAPLERLTNCLRDNHVNLSQETSWNRDALLNMIMTFLVEPHLGKDALILIHDFPASQAALAQVKMKPDGEPVAERFEFYYKGIELGNGYHELTDPMQQRERLIAASQERRTLGKTPLPIDESFIQALETGLPDCYGIAVGFDRLMMLRHHQDDIAPVLPFSWQDS